MKSNLKEKMIVIAFLFIMSSVFVINVVVKDTEMLVEERRKLTKFSDIKFQDALNSNLSDKFEKYATDQFVGRNFFRKLKYVFSDNIYMQKDNDGIFVVNHSIYKMDYKLNENNVRRSAEKIKNICSEYLNDTNQIYYSIIPEKNYYLCDEHLRLDYSKLRNIMQEELRELKYIEISDYLELESYYRTDLHWRQEEIGAVVRELINKMNGEYKIVNYDFVRIGDLYGAYYGQALNKVNPDELVYLTNDTIGNSEVYNYENNKITPVYDVEKYSKSIDKYDLFLSGATPLLKVTNHSSMSDKELIIFRDSFGSSIAPLMLDYYKSIILVDLRYVSSKILTKYIDFENKDVLFLYNSTILNSNSFR